ncbi:hypothetical protein STTU_0204 [Streptomyces sp. Tu6071]|nr:hypothetical protein STTU_0204 [Streptomyces sp. Tu6071]
MSSGAGVVRSATVRSQRRREPRDGRGEADHGRRTCRTGHPHRTSPRRRPRTGASRRVDTVLTVRRGAVTLRGTVTIVSARAARPARGSSAPAR